MKKHDESYPNYDHDHAFKEFSVFGVVIYAHQTGLETPPRYPVSQFTQRCTSDLDERRTCSTAGLRDCGKNVCSGLDRVIGDLPLARVHQDAPRPHLTKRLAKGISTGTLIRDLCGGAPDLILAARMGRQAGNDVPDARTG